MAPGHSTLSSSPSEGRSGNNYSLLVPRFLSSHAVSIHMSGLFFCFVGGSDPCKLHSQTPLPITFRKGSVKDRHCGRLRVGMRRKKGWLFPLFLVLLHPIQIVSLVVMGFPLWSSPPLDKPRSRALRIPTLQWSLTVMEAVQLPALFSFHESPFSHTDH